MKKAHFDKKMLNIAELDLITNKLLVISVKYINSFNVQLNYDDKLIKDWEININSLINQCCNKKKKPLKGYESILRRIYQHKLMIYDKLIVFNLNPHKSDNIIRLHESYLKITESLKKCNLNDPVIDLMIDHTVGRNLLILNKLKEAKQYFIKAYNSHDKLSNLDLSNPILVSKQDTLNLLIDCLELLGQVNLGANYVISYLSGLDQIVDFNINLADSQNALKIINSTESKLLVKFSHLLIAAKYDLAAENIARIIINKEARRYHDNQQLDTNLFQALLCVITTSFRRKDIEATKKFLDSWQAMLDIALKNNITLKSTELNLGMLLFYSEIKALNMSDLTKKLVLFMEKTDLTDLTASDNLSLINHYLAHHQFDKVRLSQQKLAEYYQAGKLNKASFYQFQVSQAINDYYLLIIKSLVTFYSGDQQQALKYFEQSKKKVEDAAQREQCIINEGYSHVNLMLSSMHEQNGEIKIANDIKNKIINHPNFEDLYLTDQILICFTHLRSIIKLQNQFETTQISRILEKTTSLIKQLVDQPNNYHDQELAVFQTDQLTNIAEFRLIFAKIKAEWLISQAEYFEAANYLESIIKDQQAYLTTNFDYALLVNQPLPYIYHKLDRHVDKQQAIYYNLLFNKDSASSQLKAALINCNEFTKQKQFYQSSQYGVALECFNQAIALKPQLREKIEQQIDCKYNNEGLITYLTLKDKKLGIDPGGSESYSDPNISTNQAINRLLTKTITSQAVINSKEISWQLANKIIKASDHDIIQIGGAKSKSFAMLELNDLKISKQEQTHWQTILNKARSARPHNQDGIKFLNKHQAELKSTSQEYKGKRLFAERIKDINTNSSLYIFNSAGKHL